MPSPRRKPLLVNLLWATAVVMVFSPVYVLTYAPVMRFCGMSADGNWVYKPVVLLHDKTPCRRPLLFWADVCGVGNDVRVGILYRTETDWDFYYSWPQ